MDRKQIARSVRYYVKKANRIWNLNIPNPSIEYFSKGRTAGWAQCSDNVLGFNERIAQHNPKRFKLIVIHEVSHLVAYYIWPKHRRHHGTEFFVIDRALGGGGFTLHDLDIPD